MNVGLKSKTPLPSPRIKQVTLRDPGYPERLIKLLGKKAPEVLYVMGNTDLLESESVGFCGARHSSEKGLETVRDCAEQAASAGVVVVSGYAAGIDFEAHFQALATGGTTIIVLPEGINHFRIKKAFEGVWDWERTLVVSQFDPDDTWKSFKAMARNKVIIGLSRVMIVIEAGKKGGTMNAGLETLKHHVPLYVVEYQDMSVDAQGNDKLLNMGGKRLARKRSTLRANMTFVLNEARSDPGLSRIDRQSNLL